MSEQGVNRWVLITGGAQRIGRAIALDFAGAGWDVVLHYHRSESEAGETVKKIKAMGRNAHRVTADFSDKRQTEDLIPSFTKKLGPLSALVNNASLFEPDKAAPGGHAHKSVNLEAPLVLSDIFREQVPKGRTGAVVNMLDGCMPEVGFSAYTESKKALRVMTIEMARRMAPFVRVNGVMLGPVMQARRQSAQHFKGLINATLLKTEILPQSAASTVRFLVENLSITGEILHVDGGIRLKRTPNLASAVAK